ncbi:hypothetical protein Droror1_Dr00015079 [Drosera rotundifolia]
MEITSNLNQIENTHNSLNPSSPLNSPSSHGSTTNTNTPSFPITRSDPNNPYPTTFVTADTNSFKQVVQLLTGSSTTKSSSTSIPPIKTAPTKHKLYERRSFLKNNNLTVNSSGSHRKQGSTPEILSPSLLNFPGLTLLSPVTPLTMTPVEEKQVEERAIAEKGFFLHPSPRSQTAPPTLLPLFPVTSRRGSNEE